MSTDETHPVTWTSDADILIVFRGGIAGEPGCFVSVPGSDEQVIDTQGSYPGRDVETEFQALRLKPWFDGAAKVHCVDADVFTGWSSRVAEFWSLAPIVVVGTWAVGLFVRHRIFMRWLRRKRS